MNPAQARRTLHGLIVLCICNHVVLAGSRVAMTLAALAQGAQAADVGVLLALFALLPMLLSVAAGRHTDRVGVRQPMLVGSVVLAAATAIPCTFDGLAPLYVAAPLIGMAFNLFQVAAQNATGELGGATMRARNFGLLALGHSVSLMVGPLIAGFAIDHLGFAWTFGILAMFPLLPAALLASGGLPFLPGPHPAHVVARSGGALALLRLRSLQRLFLINALVSLGWELHTIFVPLYGASIGLSASQIGMVVAAFAAATFVIRFALPVISRRLNEDQVLTGALLMSGLAYCALPFAASAVVLGITSFGIGLGLGGSQPMVMSLLHSHAPPGRMGEAAGVRMSLVQSMSVAVPLVFGAFGATFGIAPVLWSVGLCLTGGSWYTRRSTPAPSGN